MWYELFCQMARAETVDLLDLFISSVTVFVPALLTATCKSLCKKYCTFSDWYCLNFLRFKKESRENSDIFQICIFKSHVFTLDKAERYLYDLYLHFTNFCNGTERWSPSFCPHQHTAPTHRRCVRVTAMSALYFKPGNTTCLLATEGTVS